MGLRRSKRQCVVARGRIDNDAAIPDGVSSTSMGLPCTSEKKSGGTKRSGSSSIATLPDNANSMHPETVSSSSVSSAKRVKVEPDSAKSSALVSQPTNVKSGGEKNDYPSAKECELVTAALAKLHPEVMEENDQRRKEISGSCGKQDTLLDGVVSTMLSQNTTAANTIRAFANLKKTYPDWKMVVALPSPVDLEEPIKVAGLAKTRAQRIWDMCQTLQKERGEASFEYLRDMPDDEVKKKLSRFKGLGPKTISCVLLFTLGRSEFPVDTHVLRITKQMGWLPSNMNTRETAYEYLNERIPAHVKLDLHCLLIAHGRKCHRCAARGKPQFPPKDGSKLACPLKKGSR